MATITGYTAERMQEIEDGAIVDGNVVGDDLILVRRDGGLINAGSVRGEQGIQGIPGPTSIEVVATLAEIAAPTEGLYAHETDTDRLWAWTGAAWQYIAGGTDPDPATQWQAAVLTNGWMNEDSAGYGPVRYRRDGRNIQIDGSMQSGNFDVPAFTLPVGFRPQYTQWFPIQVGSAVVGRISIVSSGAATPSTPAGGTNSNVNLSGIMFPKP